MRTIKARPGKFEGNHSLLEAEAVYQASLDGVDAEAGSVTEDGIWIGMVIGKAFSWIISEDRNGFVSIVQRYRTKIGSAVQHPDCEARDRDFERLVEAFGLEEVSK
jgi:hypothetical protein